MLGIAALLLIVYLSVKLTLTLSRHKQIMSENGISSVKSTGLQLSCLLYIISTVVSMAGFSLPFSAPYVLHPTLVGLLLLLPGIILGKQLSTQLEIAGTDTAERAGRTASNIMWLGIGLGVFIIGIIVLILLLANPGSAIP